jgi:type II secretory pathway component PulJ
MTTTRKPLEKRFSGGFTLFEVLIALAVFMLAVAGLAAALDTALQTVLAVRERIQFRSMLESRLAYCQADPPQAGAPRVIEADKNHGIRIEESVESCQAKNALGAELAGLTKLTIRIRSGTRSDSAEILMNQP